MLQGVAGGWSLSWLTLGEGQFHPGQVTSSSETNNHTLTSTPSLKSPINRTCMALGTDSRWTYKLRKAQNSERPQPGIEPSCGSATALTTKPTCCPSFPFSLLLLEIYYLNVSGPLSNSEALLPHITREHYLPSGISLSSLILPRPSVLNGHHSHSLIGDCEFCHYLIIVQVSAHSGSSAPVGTSVRVHPCSHRGVKRRKAHTHFHPYAHASYCHFGY